MSELGKPLRREFRFGVQRLADPDPSLTPEQVRDLYAQAIPELTTAAVRREGEEDGTQVIAFAEAGKTSVPAVASASSKESYSFVKSQGSRG
jgi:PRTRC genetic system protein C